MKQPGKTITGVRSTAEPGKGADPGTSASWEQAFDHYFYGALSLSDDTGGYDPRPYLKDFIRKTLATQKQEILNIVKKQKADSIHNALAQASWNAALDAVCTAIREGEQ